jgi:hypothetical protein
MHIPTILKTTKEPKTARSVIQNTLKLCEEIKFLNDLNEPFCFVCVWKPRIGFGNLLETKNADTIELFLLTMFSLPIKITFFARVDDVRREK